MIKSEIDQGVMQIIFDREEKKNAFTIAMYENLNATLKEAEQNDDIQVVLFRGSEQCFTAGNDIKDFTQNPPQNEDAPVIQFLYSLASFPKILMSAVAGPAVGLGTTILPHCELVYAAPNTVFQLPFVNLGLCPEAASTYLIPQSAGYRQAAEVLLLGEPFNTEKAKQLGLINEIVPNPIEHALKIATKIAAKPKTAIRTTKKLLKQYPQQPIVQALKTESADFAKLVVSDEAKQAFKQFLGG